MDEFGGDDATLLTVSRKKPKKPKPQRHQWFDAWKMAKGGGLKTLVEATVGFVQHHEDHTKARTRARKLVDQTHHLKRIEAVVCNLAHAVLLPPPTGRIAVSTRKPSKGRSRYDSPVLGRRLSPLLMMLVDVEYLNVRAPSVMRGEASSIAPSPWFARKVAEYGVRLSDFGRDDAEEVVLLSRHTRQRPASSETGPGRLHREPIDYTDTPQTHRYRDAVRRLNRFLSEASVDFQDDGLEPRIDPFDRTLRRRFMIHPGQDVSFDQGGRLYGGFWQNLKTERRRRIRINGEPVTILDYSSMFTRLAYAEIGATPPAGDLYAIPGLEGYRSGVKLAMNTLLFDGGPRRSWPSTLGIGVGDDDEAAADPGSTAATFDARLPPGWGVARTKKAILHAHPALKEAWGRQLGYHLMFKESEILVSVLQDLTSRNIPALGLHDGLFVAVSDKDKASRAMVEAGRAAAGVVIPVSEKTL